MNGRRSPPLSSKGSKPDRACLARSASRGADLACFLRQRRGLVRGLIAAPRQRFGVFAPKKIDQLSRTSQRRFQTADALLALTSARSSIVAFPAVADLKADDLAVPQLDCRGNLGKLLADRFDGAVWST